MWYLDVNSVQTDFLILSSSFHIHSVLKLVPVLSQKSEKIHLVRTFCSSTSKRQLKTFFGLAPFRALFLEPIALFDRCENFIRKPRWFLHRFNSHWFKCSVSIFHIEYKGFLFVDFMLVVLTVSFKFPKYLSQTFLPLLSLLIFMYVFTFLFDV